MKNTVIGDMKAYVKKHGRLLFLSLVIAVLCFGFLSLSTNIRIDSEELINNPGSSLGWLTIGRYGLVLLKRLLGLTTYHAMKSGLLFLLFFVIGENLLAFAYYHFSGRNEAYPYWAFLLLYGTSNLWCFQIYFSMQQAEVAFAMLLVVFSAMLAMEACFLQKGSKRVRRIGVSVFLLVVCLGTYQALATYYIAICISFFLIRMENQKEVNAERTVGEIFGGIVLLIAQFGVSYLLYSWIANTWFMATEEYMQSQMGWGKYAVADCLKNVLRTVKNCLLAYGPRNFSFYTIGVLLSLAAVIILWRKKVFSSKGEQMIYLLAWLGLLASPFLMTLYMGEMLVTRSQFALPLVAAFLGMHGIRYLHEEKQLFARIASAGVLLVVILQVGYDLRLAYTDDKRYEQDAVLAEQILGKVVQTNQGKIPEMPVIFVGCKIPQYDGICARTEMYGWSFFEWDYALGNPTGATHRIAGFVQASTGVMLNETTTEEMKEQAVKLSEEMPTFPEDGAVVRTEDYMVVKLSEVIERTDLNWW